MFSYYETVFLGKRKKQKAITLGFREEECPKFCGNKSPKTELFLGPYPHTTFSFSCPSSHKLGRFLVKTRSNPISRYSTEYLKTGEQESAFRGRHYIRYGDMKRKSFPIWIGGRDTLSCPKRAKTLNDIRDMPIGWEHQFPIRILASRESKLLRDRFKMRKHGSIELLTYGIKCLFFFGREVRIMTFPSIKPLGILFGEVGRPRNFYLKS
jgi:hypothetical protein